MTTTEIRYCKECDFSLTVEEVEAGMDVCWDCQEVPRRAPRERVEG